MNETNSKNSSKTDWARIDAMADDEIDTSDLPELNAAFFANAELIGDENFSKVTLRLDPKIVAWFKVQGDDWEQRIQKALCLHILTQSRAKMKTPLNSVDSKQ